MILDLLFVHAGSLADLLGHFVFVTLYEANEPTEFVFHAHVTHSFGSHVRKGGVSV